MCWKNAWLWKVYIDLALQENNILVVCLYKLVMASTEHQLGDNIILKKTWNSKTNKGFFSFYIYYYQWYSNSLLVNKARVKTFLNALQCCYSRMLLVLVSHVMVLFLHAKAIASLWTILANTYMRWYGHKPTCFPNSKINFIS